MKTVEFFKAHPGTTAIISDTRKSGVVKKDDAEWVAHDANPILVEYGLQKIAFIMPEDVLAKWSVDYFRRKSEECPQTQYFTTIKDAETWLRE